MISEYYSQIIQVLVSLMIAPTVPTEMGAWTGENRWKEEGPALVYEAKSQSILSQCRQSPESYLVSPLIIQGAQQIIADGKIVASVGDASYRRAFNTYVSVYVSCADLAAVSELEWKVITETRILAHLKKMPTVRSSYPIDRFFNSTLFILISGALVAIGLIFTLVFKGKIDGSYLTSFFFGSILCAISFACYSPQNFNIEISSLFTQKVSDATLWLGIILITRAFLLFENFSALAHGVLSICASLGISIILLSASLDQIQVGSNIAMLGGAVFIVAVFYKSIAAIAVGKRNVVQRSFEFGAAVVFAITGTNDSLMYQGTIETMPLFSMGVLAVAGLFGLAVNQKISETYKERDYLRSNLEKEVEIKTEALRAKTTELESTLDHLKLAQAELLQSEKLASLGTLSAGIAHEINNSLNYVNGSLNPLKKILAKESLTEGDKRKAQSLMDLMQEGLTLTFQIISNLKAHTRPPSGAWESIGVREVAEGVVLLLKGRMNDVKVHVEVSSELAIHTERVSLSQILLNLVGNAIDALSEAASDDKQIWIESQEDAEESRLIVRDNGPGIPPEIRNRIFDPFFTTKAVGKGTGLGLHIVMAEMKKHQGKVVLNSEVGKGTTFTLHYPKNLRVQEAAA